MRGLGFSSWSTSAGERSTFLAKGNSFGSQTDTEPKADGSVHMPYSDQKPGRKMALGNARIAFRLSSRNSRSSVK